MTGPIYAAARRHLSRRSPILRPLLKQVGPCTLLPNPDHFAVLARSIVSQQISTKAAESIFGRVIAACGEAGVRPEAIARLSDADIRACGLSANKLLSLRSLTEHFQNDQKLQTDLESLTDQEVEDHLIPIRGIGVWTVHMFLIFSLGRLDVLPVGDLGLRPLFKNFMHLPNPAPNQSWSWPSRGGLIARLQPGISGAAKGKSCNRREASLQRTFCRSDLNEALGIFTTKKRRTSNRHLTLPTLPPALRRLCGGRVRRALRSNHRLSRIRWRRGEITSSRPGFPSALEPRPPTSWRREPAGGYARIR